MQQQSVWCPGLYQLSQYARVACLTGYLLLLSAHAVAQAPYSRFEAFDRYDPTQLSYAVEGVEGEHIDPRTLGLSWEVEDYVVPGDGGLDIVISRSFGRLSHTPSDMGHWYFGVPRIQIPTSPWRGPYDPARADTPTFLAAWNNLYSRLGNGSNSICAGAGGLVDEYVTGSLSGQTRGGIFFAAPIMLHIPGEGSKVLLEKQPGATQYPADVRYVTTDNWIARCLTPGPDRFWGGFEVVSPAGTRYVFDFIQYMVPGEYGTLTAGGWIEMGLSRVEDVHGNWLNYVYDLDAGGTDLLHRIEASDGRVVTLDYYPGSVLGVDVKGSPLALINRVNILADGRSVSINYSYCDFAWYYIVGIGCVGFELGPDDALPVLHEVDYPDGTRTSYRYNPSMYTANVLLGWGGFEFLLEQVTLPTGGEIHYEYDSGYSPFADQTDSPAPRLSGRTTRGRGVVPGEWSYDYELRDHIETTTMIGPARRDVYSFYEGTGTYEFMIARYPGQHEWPDTAPTDYDELMGRLQSHSVWSADGSRELRRTRHEYALPTPIGKQWYGSNWLGWPTLVLAQVRRVPETRTIVTDFDTGLSPLDYITATPAEFFDAYGMPQVQLESGHNGAADDDWHFRRTDLGWHHDTAAWVIGRPASREVEGSVVSYEYYAGTGQLSRISEFGRITEYDYHSNGNLAAVRWERDGEIHLSTFSNYHRGLARFEQYPVDPRAGSFVTIQRGVDDLGQVVWEENFAGSRTTFSYNDMGRLVRLEAPLVAPLEVQYGLVAGGRLGSVTQTRAGRRRLFDLDAFGRTTRIQEYGDSLPAEGPVVRNWQFDAAGRLLYASDPFEPAGTAPETGIIYSYDEFDRVLQLSYTADGSARTYCYSSFCNTGFYGNHYDSSLNNGYVVTDEEGYQTAFEYASFGGPAYNYVSRIVQQQSLDSGADAFVVTHIDRNAFGSVTRIGQGGADGSLATRNYFFDERQLLVSEQHPENGETRYFYDERGNRVRAVAGGTNIKRWFYDGLDRITRVDYPGAASDVEYEYDLNGQLAVVSNPLTRWEYSYNAAGQRVQERLLAAGSLLDFSYEYDIHGSLASIRYPSGNRLELKPDDFGRPRQLGDAVLTADWWPDGQLRSAVFANGTRTDIELNGRGLPSLRRVTTDSGAVLQSHSYSYDRIGNVKQIEDGTFVGGSALMDYDPLGRLARAESYWGSISVEYDVLGNILRQQQDTDFSMSYDYDPAHNRLISRTINPWPPLPYTYDARGNVTSNGNYDFIYNAASQLVAVSQYPDVAWRYDGYGHRTLVEQDGSQDISVYNRNGQLMHLDRCESRNLASDFLYLGSELVARFDEPCEGGCHP